MTVDSLLTKLENGEEVTTPKNGALLYILQSRIDNNYNKFSIDINIEGKTMTFKRRGDFERKT